MQPITAQSPSAPFPVYPIWSHPTARIFLCIFSGARKQAGCPTPQVNALSNTFILCLAPSEQLFT